MIRKIILTGIFCLIVSAGVSAAYDSYDTYLDSLEQAVDNNSVERILDYSDILIESNPGRYEGYYYKAFAYYKNNDLDAAARFCSQSIDIEDTPENRYLMLLVKEAEGRDIGPFISKCISDFPSDMRFVNSKAAYFYKKARYDSAFHYYNTVLRNEPYNESALLHTANILFIKKQYDRALDVYRQLTSQYSNEGYMYNTALTYSKLGYYDRSNEIFSDLKNSEYGYRAMKNMINNYRRMERPDSAFALSIKSINHYPDSTAGYSSALSVLSDKYDKEKADTLVSLMLKNSIEKRPLLASMGALAFNADDTDNSLPVYSRLLAQSPEFTSKTAVQTYFFAGRQDTARSLMERFDISDDSLFYYRFGGIIDYKAGLYESARNKFLNASKLLPGDTAIIYNLANTFYMLREDAALLQLIDSIASQNPQFSARMQSEFFGDSLP